jgi:hypothetical protein
MIRFAGFTHCSYDFSESVAEHRGPCTSPDGTPCFHLPSESALLFDVLGYHGANPLRSLRAFVLVPNDVEERVFRFSVKWRVRRSPLASIPPLRGGDFQGIGVYRSDVYLGRARKANFRAQKHRLDEPTKVSLGMVASLQSPLPFPLARSL